MVFVLVVAVRSNYGHEDEIEAIRSSCTTLQDIPKPYTLDVKHSLVTVETRMGPKGLQSLRREWLFEELPVMLAVMVKIVIAVPWC